MVGLPQAAFLLSVFVRLVGSCDVPRVLTVQVPIPGPVQLAAHNTVGYQPVVRSFLVKVTYTQEWKVDGRRCIVTRRPQLRTRVA
ncbi:hypothetical protein GA0061078_0513 [Bifidobacterium bohemicum]|uniref:Uncharacterized protein n=1 Tax=Bifidobacterium bohemicum DSM 22767 TaxID=1437606 RepID=A0A086ZJQ9_9BIFI|nr:hypothetical protein BBOH_0231 [Bifidobacterium bohemicum DSM 22767]SCB80742.1 hypothetical protein GA0061078_0513 [Bifidobacterium bohemicum]